MDIHLNTKKEELLEVAKDCQQCGSCCSYGGAIVMEHEIPKMAGSLDHSAKSFKEEFLEPVEFFNTNAWKFKSIKKEDKPYGPCTFLKGKRCEIHDVKPLHCRIGICKDLGDKAVAWFMINNFVNLKDPESIRQYNAYVKTGGLVLRGAELETFVPDKTRLKHILEYKILK